MKAAVIPSPGIGDGLLMMIAARALHEKGYEVTLFHNQLQQLASLFPFCHFCKRVSIQERINAFDQIILENDNSPLAFSLIDQRTAQHLSVFYPSYCSKKHRPLTSNDYVFNSTEPMTKGIANALSHLLNVPFSTSNGIVLPKTLSPNKYPKRVIIHPTSGSVDKNWPPERFLKLAKMLKKAGWTPVFCVSPSEKKGWIHIIQGKFLVPDFPTLTVLAKYLYESSCLIGNDSGIAHLASNLNKPTLVIAKCRKQIALWRPGWRMGKIITPPRWIPNIKMFRLRENKWKTHLFPGSVYKTFLSMMKGSSDILRDERFYS